MEIKKPHLLGFITGFSFIDFISGNYLFGGVIFVLSVWLVKKEIEEFKELK